MGGPAHTQPTFPIPDPDRATAPPLLLVDGHNLLWTATFGFPAPIYSRDKTRELTGLFAFFALLRVAIRDHFPQPPEVIVVFDGQHGAATRRHTHDGYKTNRPTDPAALKPLHHLADVQHGLTNHTITWIDIDHYEADDVIATLTHTTPAPRTVTILSRDQDYYQLITDRTTILNTRLRADRRMITPQQVYARHHVTPRQWCDYRALAGDPADNIPGIPGIGPTTAAKLLDGGLTLDDLPASGRLTTTRGRIVAQHHNLALKWRDMIRLNTDLHLPHHPTGQPSPALPRPADIVEHLGLW